MDFRTLNDMLFLDQLPDICGIVGAWAQLPTAEAREDLVQVLLGKVRNMLRRRTVYNHNFRHFISMQLMSCSELLPSSDASMISSSNFLMASGLFLIANRGSLQLLGFLHRTHHPYHHSHPNREMKGIQVLNFYCQSTFTGFSVVCISNEVPIYINIDQ